jgi:EmrB/QacA subfamily drug resistance transporter
MPVNPENATVDSDVSPPELSTSGPGTSGPGAGSRAALIALGLAALLAVLDGTVVAVALQSLTVAFAAPLTTVVWVTIAYLLAAAAMLPLLGWASARFGGRAVFLAGLALFVTGSMLSALAWSAESLIAFRVVQGFGGGLLEPTSLALAAGLAGKDRVGRVLGTMAMIINVAPVLGPLLGGLVLGTGHWQWIFIVNIPLGLAVLVAALAFIPADRPDRSTTARPVADVRGLLLLTGGYLAVLFALNRSGQPGAGPLVLLTAVVGLLMLGGYVRHALTAPRPPALDLRLLRRPGFAAALMVMGLVGLIMYSQVTALPIFGAERHHLQGFDQGLLVCALGLGLLVSMTTAGRISDRTGPRPLVRAGAVVTAVGLLSFALAHDSLPLPALFVLFIGIGLGFGATASPTFASVYRTLPSAEQAQGTTALFMTVQLTASLGVTILGVLQSRAPEQWLTVLFILLTVAAVAIAGLGRALPGRPAPVGQAG